MYVLPSAFSHSRCEALSLAKHLMPGHVRNLICVLNLDSIQNHFWTQTRIIDVCPS